MKKYVAVLAMVSVLGLTAGCKTQEAAKTETAVEIAEGKTVTGIIDEIADYYFSIQVEDGTYYQFPFVEESIMDLGDAVVGDTITLTYDGELSDVDMFDGILLGYELVK